jgi:hypothetical protein
MSYHDHQVMLCESGDNRQNELHQVRDLAAAQVAGVVIVPTPKPHQDVSRLLRAIPHVQLLRRVPALSQHWFGIDDETVLHTATSHLLDLGHRRIAYVAGTTDIPTAASQLAGFGKAIKDAGLAQGVGVAELGAPSSAAHGADALRRLMATPEPPTAIVTGSIQLTRVLLAAAHADRLVVPRDLSVVGFGDEPGFSWWGPGRPPCHCRCTISPRLAVCGCCIASPPPQRTRLSQRRTPRCLQARLSSEEAQPHRWYGLMVAEARANAPSRSVPRRTRRPATLGWSRCLRPVPAVPTGSAPGIVAAQ